MKKYIFFVLGLLGIPALSIAHTIYGLDSARTYHGKKHQHLYIALASYQIKENAHNVYRHFHARDPRVSIKYSNHLYKVFAGPFSSAAEVRLAARNLSLSSTTPITRKVIHRKQLRHRHYRKYTQWSTYSVPHETTIRTFSPGSNHHAFTLQLGGYFASIGHEQHINIEGLVGDYFSKDSGTAANGLIGAGVYSREWEAKRIRFSWGVNAFYLPNVKVSGTVTQEDLFTNLSYHYYASQLPIYLVAKSAFHLDNDRTNLTLDFGVGPNFFHTSSVAETSLDGGITIPDQTYSGKTSTTFGATAGLGIRLDRILGDYPVECGYRFFYFGRGSFNKITDQLLDNFGTGTAYANAGVCSVAF